MLTLGIIDELTENDLTAGKIIAGTGTINYLGEVGPIGGIRQKLEGAHKSGAQLFLAPIENCADSKSNKISIKRIVKNKETNIYSELCIIYTKWNRIQSLNPISPFSRC